MVDKALRNNLRNPQFAYIAPTYGQAKRVAWEMLKDYTRQIPGVVVNEADLRVDIPRPGSSDKVRLMLLGAENPGSVRGIYLDGVILDEYAEMDPSIWGQVIRPALSDRLGWAIFIGTPKGQNHFYDIFQIALKTPGWFSSVFKASVTKILPESELEAARREMSEEEYDQDFECSFTAALIGAYYGKILESLETKGQITRVPHDPALLVDTYWDLGVGDTTAVWLVQQYRFEYRVIKFMEQSGVGLDWWAKELKKLDFVYRAPVWPHDGAARELTTGKSRAETFFGYFKQRPEILPRENVDDGIEEVRKLLPKCWFDLENCSKGITALKNYQRKFDSKNKIFVPKPMHNWASHGADAFRTFAMGTKPESARNDGRELPTQAETEYNVF